MEAPPTTTQEYQIKQFKQLTASILSKDCINFSFAKSRSTMHGNLEVSVTLSDQDWAGQLSWLSPSTYSRFWSLFILFFQVATLIHAFPMCDIRVWTYSSNMLIAVFIGGSHLLLRNSKNVQSALWANSPGHLWECWRPLSLAPTLSQPSSV